MVKRVIFHVGLSKTGSTTIQGYLRNQDEHLRSLGFLYPGPREHAAMVTPNHPLMLNAMTGNVNAPSEGLDAQACRNVAALTFRKFRASDLENLLWSYETMASNARNWDANYLTRILGDCDVRIVFFARYTDDWIESSYGQSIWERAGPRAETLAAEPLPPLSTPRRTVEGQAARQGGGMLGRGARIIENLRIMRETVPWAEIVVRSFDANRDNGKVVSGALAAMGVPVEGAFVGADDRAGVRNPTKSALYTMLLYHLVMAEAGVDVIRDVAAAAQKRSSQGHEFAPLIGRRYRFLSDENIIQARGFYEELRQEYPSLPKQPPNGPKPAERCFPRDEAVALLDWLRPDISDNIFDKARAAYPRT